MKDNKNYELKNDVLFNHLMFLTLKTEFEF